MQFTAPLWHWRGPAPHYFLRVPDDIAADLKAASRLVTYGWGMIPVTVHTTVQTTMQSTVQATMQATGWAYDTSLFPKDGGYLVPIRADIRRLGSWQAGDEVTVRLDIRAGKAGRGLWKNET